MAHHCNGQRKLHQHGMCMLICCELRSTGTFVREDPGCLFHGGPTLLRPQPLTTLLTTIPCGQKSLWINEGSQRQNTGKAFLLCFRQSHVRAGTIEYQYFITNCPCRTNWYPQISCILCMSHICFVSSPAISILDRYKSFCFTSQTKPASDHTLYDS